MRYTMIVVRLALTLFTGALLLTGTQTLTAHAATPAAAPAGWSIVSSPNHGTVTNDLRSVSCASVSACKAVGFYNAGGVHHTLIESWNGVNWSIDPSPNKGFGNNVFGVSCASVSSCKAVGFYNAGGVHHTLIESWNGVNWSIDPSPNKGTGDNILDGVSCPPATMSCKAVGYYYISLGVTKTLIESWNGTTWSIVPSPNSVSTANILYGVSCHAPDSCQAVGYNVNNTLIESWNGTTWSIVPSPNNGTSINLLLSVSCYPAAISCQAVGEYANASLGAYQTLVESWNGASWSIVPSPNNGTSDNELMGVSCDSPGPCQAVGLYRPTSLSAFQTLIESWDGTSWSLDPSPNGGTAYNVLSGVSCRPSANTCQAVGDFKNPPGTYQSLVETNG